ncbi:UDP-glucose 4-epimerase GalE [Methylophilaceae bacterium]|nr:UDP-glucose 4-epimerase GalE [Methylophilaceae bacterium]
MNNEDNILITGGLGFIGSHIVTSLSNSYKNIVLLDNLSNSKIQTFNKIRKLTNHNVNFIKTSINNSNLIDNLFSQYKFKTVIHLAGFKAVGESWNLPGKYFYNNVLGSQLFFETIQKHNVQNLIFSSSATVYGKPIFLPLRESHPIRAMNPYAQNKIDIEQLLIKDDFFLNKCSVKILRYFNPIGAHPSGLIGEDPPDIPNNLMPYILRVAKQQLKSINIFGNDYNTPDGTGVRDFIHIMDLVDGHLKAISYEKKGISIFNLGTGKGFSVLNLIKTFENVNHLSVPYKITARRAGDVAMVYADVSKAESLLKFKAKRSLEAMCRDAWRFAQKSL